MHISLYITGNNLTVMIALKWCFQVHIHIGNDMMRLRYIPTLCLRQEVYKIPIETESK